MKKMYAVRVVQTMLPDGSEVHEGGEINGALLDYLRYAGVITVHETYSSGLTVTCFDIEDPMSITGSQSKAWSERNAERMRSFGFNAVSAPSTCR